MHLRSMRSAASVSSASSSIVAGSCAMQAYWTLAQLEKGLPPGGGQLPASLELSVSPGGIPSTTRSSARAMWPISVAWATPGAARAPRRRASSPTASRVRSTASPRIKPIVPDGVRVFERPSQEALFLLVVAEPHLQRTCRSPRASSKDRLRTRSAPRTLDHPLPRATASPIELRSTDRATFSVPAGPRTHRLVAEAFQRTGRASPTRRRSPLSINALPSSRYGPRPHGRRRAAGSARRSPGVESSAGTSARGPHVAPPLRATSRLGARVPGRAHRGTGPGFGLVSERPAQMITASCLLDLRHSRP